MQTSVRLMQNIVTTRNPEIFQEPDTFNPDRWLREDGERYAKICAFAAQPFGFGPRSCLGQRFAEMEMHVCVAKVMQNDKAVFVDVQCPYVHV